MSLATCDLASVHVIPCGNHAQLGGGSVAERLMSTLAYGWVERCSDVASCGVNSSSKISTGAISSLQCLLFHECMMFPLCMINNRIGVCCFR